MTDENTCSLSFCDREAFCKAKNAKVDVCRSHYNQDWAGKEFTPIRTYKKTHVDANGRVCTTCENYKSWDEYYGRTARSVKQAECKSCMVKRSQRNRAEREALGEPCIKDGCDRAAVVKGMCSKDYMQHYYNERKTVSK